MDVIIFEVSASVIRQMFDVPKRPVGKSAAAVGVTASLSVVVPPPAGNDAEVKSGSEDFVQTVESSKLVFAGAVSMPRTW